MKKSLNDGISHEQVKFSDALEGGVSNLSVVTGNEKWIKYPLPIGRIVTYGQFNEACYKL